MLNRIIYRFSQQTSDVVFTGIQPTGNLHIGNYLGSIQNILKLQKTFSKLYISVVDYHALTNNLVVRDNQIIAKSQNSLSQETFEMYSTLLACGVHPSKTTIFVQSHVPQHAELSWILGCITPHHWLNTMIQYKQKKLKNNNPSLGLYSYPVLMAADIILYKATKVPVGSDQLQHLELTNKIIQRFNKIYKSNLLKPQYIQSPTPRVMSLVDAGKKMSKSNSVDKSRINLTDDDDIIRMKIMKAKTDPIQTVYTDPLRFQINNLIGLYAAINDIDIDKVNIQIKDKKITEFKQQLAESIIRKISPIRRKIEEYKSNQSQVTKIIKEAKEKVRKEAQENMMQFKKIIGMHV